MMVVMAELRAARETYVADPGGSAPAGIGSAMAGAVSAGLTAASQAREAVKVRMRILVPPG
ncbi:hypothetical protein [Methylobacterium oryzae]|uniref:hypothetical protein n=1 Tax=Methylobacterium oryzae TaxID=334852 RepID=UPI00225BCCAD|nr:hypothetical protein [Methylobacterium organophilum]